MFWISLTAVVDERQSSIVNNHNHNHWKSILSSVYVTVVAYLTAKTSSDYQLVTNNTYFILFILYVILNEVEAGHETGLKVPVLHYVELIS